MSLAKAQPISFKNVHLCYGEQPVLNDVSVTFGERGISFLVGENGAGKTQMLRCIHGLNTPHSGAISAPPRDKQAFLYQDPILLNRSVADNLYFIRGCPAAPAAHFDEQFNAIIERLTLLDLLSENALTLSGGQRKRVALARLLLQRADCYLFDEPGANIDRKNNRIIESTIAERVQCGHKIVIATHDFLQLERLFCNGRDEILVLKNGRLAYKAQRPTTELFSQYL